MCINLQIKYITILNLLKRFIFLYKYFVIYVLKVKNSVFLNYQERLFSQISVSLDLQDFYIKLRFLYPFFIICIQNIENLLIIQSSQQKLIFQNIFNSMRSQQNLFKQKGLKICFLLLLNILFISKQIESAQESTLLQINNNTISKYQLNEEKQFTLATIQKKGNENKKLYLKANLHDTVQSNKFLEPSITLFSSKGRILLICNQATAKFYQICSIQLKNIFQIQSTNKLQNLKVKVMSLQAQVQILLSNYISDTYQLFVGQQIFLEADQYKEDQIQKQKLMISVPSNINEYQLIYFQLYDQGSLSPYSNIISSTNMRIYYKYSDLLKGKNSNISQSKPITPQQLQKSLISKQCKPVSFANKMSCSLNTQQLILKRTINIQITYNDQYSRLRFYSYFAQIQKNNEQQSIQTKVSQINSYYDFQIRRNEKGVNLKYNNFLFANLSKKTGQGGLNKSQEKFQDYIKQTNRTQPSQDSNKIEGQDLQLAIYIYSGQIKSIKLSTDINYVNSYSFYQYKNNAYLNDLTVDQQNDDLDQHMGDYRKHDNQADSEPQDDPNPSNLPYEIYDPNEFRKKYQNKTSKTIDKNSATSPWKNGNILSSQQLQKLNKQIQQSEKRIKKVANKKPIDFLLFTIKKHDLREKLFKNQTNKTIAEQKNLYLQILSLEEEVSFYVTLRDKQIDNTIELEWPQIIDYSELVFSKNYIVEDWVELNVNQKTRFQKYYIQIDNLMNYYGYLQNLYNNNQTDYPGSANPTIQPQNNKINLTISRCSSVQNSRNLDCLHENIYQIDKNIKQQFIPLMLQRSTHMDYKKVLSFEYDLGKCPLINVSKDRKVHKCYFKFYLERKEAYQDQESPTQQMRPFALTLKKPTRLLPLKLEYTRQQIQDSMLYRVTSKRQLNYYLAIPIKQTSMQNLQRNNISRTTIHLTTFYGDCILFGSRTQKFPLYELIDKSKYDIGTNGYLKIQDLSVEDKLAEYYLGVYCYVESSFDLNVYSNFKSNDQQNQFSNQLILKDKVPKKITLFNNQIAKFVINQPEPGYMSLEIDQLQGKVLYTVYYYGQPDPTQIQRRLLSEKQRNLQFPLQTSQEDEQQQNSQSFLQGSQQQDTQVLIQEYIQCRFELSHSKRCSFKIKANESVYVQVTPSKFSNEITQFTIATYKTEECINYSFNVPKLINLQSNTQSCSIFRITKYQDLQISFYTTHTEFFSSNIEISISFNNKNYPISNKNMIKFFKRQQIIQLCNQSNQNQENQNQNLYNKCQLKITLRTRKSQGNLTFSQVVQYMKEQRQLFNGLETISSIHNSDELKTKQYFYYIEDQVDQSKDLKISFYSQNNKKILLYCYVQNAKNYQLNKYKQIESFSQTKDTDRQIFILDLNETQTYKYLYIPLSKIKCDTTESNPQKQEKNQSCVLLINVQSTQQNTNKNQQSIYQLEINEGVTYLQIGQTVQDIVKHKKYQQYVISGYKQYDTIVSIVSQNLQKNDQKCFQTNIIAMNSYIDQPESKFFSKEDKFIIKANQTSQPIVIDIRMSEQATQLAYCNYKISYTKLHKKLLQIQNSKQVYLQYVYSQYLINSKFTFFMYKHILNNKSPSQSQSFRIIPQFKSVTDVSKYRLYAIQILSSNDTHNKLENKTIQSIFTQLDMEDPSNAIKALKMGEFYQDINKELLKYVSKFPFKQNVLDNNNGNLIRVQNQYGLTVPVSKVEEADELQIFKYYLIALQNKAVLNQAYQMNYDQIDLSSSFQEQVTIVIEQEAEPINLLHNFMLFDKISPQSTNQKIYTFFPQQFTTLEPYNDTFSIHFHSIYGQMNFTVVDPTGKPLIQYRITKEHANQQFVFNIQYKMIQIKDINSEVIQIPQQNSEYAIKVSSNNKKEAAYSIQIKKDRDSKVNEQKLIQKVAHLISFAQKNVLAINSFYQKGSQIQSSKQTISNTYNMITLFITYQNGQTKYNFSKLVHDHLNIYFQQSSSSDAAKTLQNEQNSKIAQLPEQDYQMFMNKNYCRIQFVQKKNRKYYVVIKKNKLIKKDYLLQLTYFSDKLYDLYSQEDAGYFDTMLPLSLGSSSTNIVPFNSIIKAYLPANSQSTLIEISLSQPKPVQFYISSSLASNQMVLLQQKNNNENIKVFDQIATKGLVKIYVKNVSRSVFYLKAQNVELTNNQIKFYQVRVEINSRQYKYFEYIKTQQTKQKMKIIGVLNYSAFVRQLNSLKNSQIIQQPQNETIQVQQPQQKPQQKQQQKQNTQPKKQQSDEKKNQPIENDKPKQQIEKPTKPTQKQQESKTQSKKEQNKQEQSVPQQTVTDQIKTVKNQNSQIQSSIYGSLSGYAREYGVIVIECTIGIVVFFILLKLCRWFRSRFIVHKLNQEDGQQLQIIDSSNSLPNSNNSLGLSDSSSGINKYPIQDLQSNNYKSDRTDPKKYDKNLKKKNGAKIQMSESLDQIQQKEGVQKKYDVNMVGEIST